MFGGKAGAPTKQYGSVASTIENESLLGKSGQSVKWLAGLD